MIAVRVEAIADKTDKRLKIMWEMHISSQVVAESRPPVLHTRKNYSRHNPAPTHTRSVQALLFYVE